MTKLIYHMWLWTVKSLCQAILLAPDTRRPVDVEKLVNVIMQDAPEIQ